MRWWVWLTFTLPVAAHTISMSTGKLEVHGTSARLELRIPAYEAQHVPNPERAIPEAFDIQGARRRDAACSLQGSGFICRIDFENVSIPVKLRCRLAQVIVENHVHVIHATYDGRVDQAVFDSNMQEAILRFRQAGPVESAVRVRPQLLGVGLLVFVIGSLLAASWRVALTGVAMIAGTVIGAAASRWLPWQLTPGFLEISAVVIAGYAAFELIFLPSNAFRVAVAGMLGIAFGMYTSGLMGNSSFLVAASIAALSLFAGAGIKMWRRPRVVN